MFDISPLAQCHRNGVRQTIDNKTKPPGALGQLESLACQLALITGPSKIQLNRPTMLVFAADHGIAEEGISIAPSEVTRQMVMNFLNGGAAINCFCDLHGMEIDVVDAGILKPICDDRLTNQSLGFGTANFVQKPAMDINVADKGIQLGAEVTYKHYHQGCNIFGFGEMGIGNTSSAAALMSVITTIPLRDCVGRGTGIDDVTYEKKIRLLEKSIHHHQAKSTEMMSTLATFGGFEIVQMVGAMLAAAQSHCVLMIDGFIATVAALVASKIEPNALDYMVFCHESEEKGHQKLLAYLNVETLLSLNLRLGEGTGAALALPMLKSAQVFYNHMASFESAGIEVV